MKKIVMVICIVLMLLFVVGCNNQNQNYLINTYELITAPTEANAEVPIIKEVTIELFAPYEEKTINLTQEQIDVFIKDLKELEFSFNSDQIKEARSSSIRITALYQNANREMSWIIEKYSIQMQDDDTIYLQGEIIYNSKYQEIIDAFTN